MFAMPEVANTIPPLFLDAMEDADDVVDADDVDVVCIEAPSVSRRKKRKASVVIDLE
jgi:hypothetical protein